MLCGNSASSGESRGLNYSQDKSRTLVSKPSAYSLLDDSVTVAMLCTGWDKCTPRRLRVGVFSAIISAPQEKKIFPFEISVALFPLRGKFFSGKFDKTPLVFLGLWNVSELSFRELFLFFSFSSFSAQTHCKIAWPCCIPVWGRLTSIIKISTS